MGHLSTIVTVFEDRLMQYAQESAKGISDAQFARLPQGSHGAIDTNHPAFIFGHLSVYPEMLMGLIGVEGATGMNSPDDFKTLFLHGNPCRDDPDGSIYPSKEVIMSHFFKTYKAGYAAIAEQTDDFLAQAMDKSENEFVSGFPSRGALSAFMLGAHPFLHIGQLSAWRRCMGLGPIF